MPRKQHKYHYIYKTTCSVTGRWYIGMHSTHNLEDEYIGSGKRLWLSINKHGRDAHTKEILEFLPNRESLKAREKELVNESLLTDPLCMNLQIGGGGGFIGEAIYIVSVKARMERIRKIGYTDKEKAGRIKTNTKLVEYNKSELGRKKSSERFLGKKKGPLSESHKIKMSNSTKGRTGLNKKPIRINNENYDGLHDASKILKIPVTTIRFRLLSNNFKDWIYV